MNRLRAAKQPVSLCTPLTLRIGPMLEMAVIFLGLASIPRSNTMYRSSFPFGTPKTHFLGFNLMLNLLRFANVAAKFAIRLHARAVFDHYVVNIDGDCWFRPFILIRLIRRVNLVGKALLHAPLVGGANIL